MLEKLKKIYRENPDEPFLGQDSLICMLTAFWVVMPIVRLMQKLKMKIHPNVITIISLLFILYAGYCFFVGQLIIGAVLYFVYFLGDVLDGKWARLTKQTSKIGVKLDHWASIIGNMGMFFGLWYSQYYLANNWLLGLSLITTYYMFEVFLLILVKNERYKTIFSPSSSYYSLQEEGFCLFFISPILSALTILFPILLLLQVINFGFLVSKQDERPNIKLMIKQRILKST